MARAPRSPRIDLAPLPPAVPSVGAWQRHKPRPAQARPAAAGPRGGDAAPPPAPDEPASPVAGVEASGAADPDVAILGGEALSTAEVVAERASPLRPSSGSAPRGGAAGARAAAGPEPVRLVVPTAASPFAPGREVAFARVQGDLLAGLGVRDGDHVALWRRDTAEPGDLAAVLDATGRAGLWRVYPERDELRLTTGDPAYARPSGRRPRVQGVVVAVHRSFSARPVAARASSGRAAAPPTARPRSTNAASARGTPLTTVPPRVSGRGA